MEIAPIPGLRAVPVVKTPSAEERLEAVFDLESPARASDDSYTGDAHKGPGGQDDATEDLTDAPAGGAESEAGAEDDPPRRINVFA